MKIPKLYKEILRYVIIALIMFATWDLSIKAYELEVVSKLTLQFAGVVASAYGVLTMVLKFIFQSKVED